MIGGDVTKKRIMGGAATSEDSGLPIYDISTHSWGYTDSEKRDSTFLAAFVLMMIIALTLSALIQKRISILPEACVVLTVGLVAGFACKLMYGATHMNKFSKPLLTFDNALFFLALLPPIIFNSGYDLHPRWLFGLLVQIMAFAIAGTFVSALVVGVTLTSASAAGLAPKVSFAETLTFGALISATDPVSVLAVFTELKVDPKMFYLVFGESVLNDAVGIVLFKTFSKYVGFENPPYTLLIAVLDFVVIFVGSMFLGFACAIGTALCLKALRAPPLSDESKDDEEGDDDDDDAVIETSRHLQMAVLACAIYLPAFLAELVELSGIVATLFAAIGVRHWGMPNLQERHEGDVSQNKLAESLLGTVAHLADTAVFLYLGLSVPASVDDWKKHYSHSFVAWSIFACLVGRAVHVYPLSYICNRHVVRKAAQQFSGRPRSMARVEAAVKAGAIPRNMQHMLWFSGLRGAVAFSCAHTFPDQEGHAARFVVTTCTIIIVSMYLLGAATVPVLTRLNIPTNCQVEREDDESPTHPARDSRRDAAILALRRDRSGRRGSYCARDDSVDSVPSSSSPRPTQAERSSSHHDDDEDDRARRLMDADALAMSFSPTSASQEAPRPARPLIRLGLLDEAYIYPAVVRHSTRRSRPSRKKRPATPSTSNRSSRFNNGGAEDDDDDESGTIHGEHVPLTISSERDEDYQPPRQDVGQHLEMIDVAQEGSSSTAVPPPEDHQEDISLV